MSETKVNEAPAATQGQSTNIVGRVTQVRGAVVDVQFEGTLPHILDALHVTFNGQTVVLEVAQEIGEHEVRCIAMDSTDGLTRGAEVVATAGGRRRAVRPMRSRWRPCTSLPRARRRCSSSVRAGASRVARPAQIRCAAPALTGVAACMAVSSAVASCAGAAC